MIKNRELKIKSIILPNWKFKLLLLGIRLKKIWRNINKTRSIERKLFYFETGWSGFSITYEKADYDNRAHIQIYIIWGKLFIYPSQKLKEYIKEEYEHSEPDKYGIVFFEKTIMFYFRKKCKIYNLPWDLDWMRTSWLKNDNTWEHELRKQKRKDFWKEEWENKLWKEIHNYTYKLKNGTIQKRKATIKVVEREWRMRFLRWTKKFNKVSKSIDIDFDGEVGERSGSWKGGTIGCGYQIKDGETPLQTLRRMERERKF